jgi:hypothetical protein
MAGEHIFVNVECDIRKPRAVRNSAASLRVSGVSSAVGIYAGRLSPGFDRHRANRAMQFRAMRGNLS